MIPDLEDLPMQSNAAQRGIRLKVSTAVCATGERF
jgi:hypothetical protein